MRVVALILVLASGSLAGLVTVNYLEFLRFGGDVSEKIALAERTADPEVLEELGHWHAQAFETYKVRLEWMLFATGMLALLMFLHFIYLISRRH